MRRNLLLAGLLIFVSVACSLFASSSQEDIQSAVETSLAQTDAARVTDTPIPTDTPVPTNSPAPTDTFSPTDTLLPPTKTREPTDTPTDVSKVAYVTIVNNLSTQLTVKLKGPEVRSFVVRANSELEIEIEPGMYEFTLSAPGFISLSDVQIFLPGKNPPWEIGKKKQ